MAGTDEDAHAETVLSAVERRLARLRFDLHDGPLQDVHLLAMDLSLLREGLLESVAAREDQDRLVGLLDDTTAQLVALDRDLRQLITSVQSPFLPPGSFPEMLREIASAFAGRTGVKPQITVAGDFSTLTDSQQITLLAVMREALSNIRKHGDADSVSITISAHDRGVDAEVIDDGRGFDPPSALASAAQGGHLGIVGMRERVRMLGGETEIESRPGGPTRISVTLPPWART